MLWTASIWLVQVTLQENKGINYCCRTFQWLELEKLLCGNLQHHPAMSGSRELLSLMLWPFHHRNSDWAAFTLLHVGKKMWSSQRWRLPLNEIFWTSTYWIARLPLRLSELIPLCLNNLPWPPFTLHTALFIFESDISQFLPLLPRPLLYPLKMPICKGTILIFCFLSVHVLCLLL